MGTPFFLNQLSGVWREAVERNEPTVAFEVAINQGRFLFLMFFDPEDVTTKDRLLLFLQNTMVMLPLKMYGAHTKGIFQIFLGTREIAAIREELQLGVGATAFSIEDFMADLDSRIPATLPLARKIAVLRANRGAMRNHLNEVLDLAERTELIGELPLPANKKPREKTLRKLYLYSNNSPEAIARYIEELKARNVTLAWRVPKTKA
jgi:hypothetical protein